MREWKKLFQKYKVSHLETKIINDLNPKLFSLFWRNCSVVFQYIEIKLEKLVRCLVNQVRIESLTMMLLESVGTALFTDIFLLTVAFPVHVRLHTNCLTYHGSLAPKLFMSMMKLPFDSGGRPHALITFKCYTEANSAFRYTGVLLVFRCVLIMLLWETRS